VELSRVTKYVIPQITTLPGLEKSVGTHYTPNNSQSKLCGLFILDTPG
jgi:hypothetical protein